LPGHTSRRYDDRIAKHYTGDRKSIEENINHRILLEICIPICPNSRFDVGMDAYLIWYPDFHLSGKICLQPDCMFYAGSDFYNPPMQPDDCLTDAESTVCALLVSVTQISLFLEVLGMWDSKQS